MLNFELLPRVNLAPLRLCGDRSVALCDPRSMEEESRLDTSHVIYDDLLFTTEPRHPHGLTKEEYFNIQYSTFNIFSPPRGDAAGRGVKKCRMKKQSTSSFDIQNSIFDIQGVPTLTPLSTHK
jgi:hypothetical protein